MTQFVRINASRTNTGFLIKATTHLPFGDNQIHNWIGWKKYK